MAHACGGGALRQAPCCWARSTINDQRIKKTKPDRAKILQSSAEGRELEVPRKRTRSTVRHWKPQAPSRAFAEESVLGQNRDCSSYAHSDRGSWSERSAARELPVKRALICANGARSTDVRSAGPGRARKWARVAWTWSVGWSAEVATDNDGPIEKHVSVSFVDRVREPARYKCTLWSQSPNLHFKARHQS